MNSIYDKRPWLKLYPEWLAHELEVPENTALDDFMASAARRFHPQLWISLKN
ncbi:MAG: hypothetical protein JRK53_05365 [Deltaproteobacteria bacterium]|nr:hypothetical protein [Deltaproteobacteria bacterium]